MPPSKRKREAARRRHAEERAAQAAREKARRRQRTIGLVVVGALVITLGVSATIALGGDREQGATPPVAEETAPTTAPDSTSSRTVPEPSLAEARAWTGTIKTNRGEVEIELDGAAAPQAVANFVSLAHEDFFDDTKCHRLVTSGIFILQCGDPEGTGRGGPGYRWGPIENAPADDVYPAGTLAMARVGHDGFSMGSQFFLVYEDSPIPSDSAGGYTVFGRITSGLDVVQAIADEGNGDDGVAPKSDVIIEGVLVQ